MITSRLKILSDITCQLYCDGKNIGEIISGQLFYLDLRKGKYILEFKIGNLVLDTLRYTMISNDEDDLLEITLLEVYNAIKTQQHFELVKNYNVYWSYTGSNWRISSSCNEILNQATNETWIDLPCNYILLPMGSQNDPDIDCCGYIPFNLGGVLHCDEVHGNYVEGGLWGVINKIGETIISPKYDEKVFFRNNQVTSVKSRSQIEVINFLGEQVFKEFILIRPIDENNGLYQVTNNEYKKGIIDRFGRPLISPIYSSLIITSENTVWAHEPYCNCWGLLDIKSNILLPFQYEKIIDVDGGFYTLCNGKWGCVQCNGTIIENNIYSIVSSFTIEKYISGTTPDDYHIDFDEFSIVKKNNKYGIVNTNFGYSFGNHIKSAIIHEIIPCIYDAIYSEHGDKYTDKDLTELTKAELGFPNGRFKIDESYFVSSQDELLHCNRYNMSGKLLYAFSCEAFNRHYIVKSNNYYFINHRYGPEEEAYDYISEISCLSGRIDVDPIYPDSWNHYSSPPTPKGYLKYMRANLLPIAHKEDTWHVFSDFGKKDLLFSCKCSRIVEYGRYEEGCYYAIVESNNSKLIYIIKDSKIIFQSYPMQNISSSYKLINERSSYDKYHDGKYISNYFIAMQHNGKEIVIKWNSFEESAICSEEYDEINLINDESVRVCKYADGTNLYNKMIIYCDGFALLSEKWCKSQLATLFL